MTDDAKLPLHERLAFEYRELAGRIDRAEQYIALQGSPFTTDAALLQDQLQAMRAYKRALAIRYARAKLGA